jgi:urease beta subunit
MIPGEVSYQPGTIIGNAGCRTVTIAVENMSDRDIQVTSHYHFFEVNKRLRFDRAQAFGMHLDIPPGTTIRFEPGQRQVRLVARWQALDRVAGLTNGQANEATKAVLQRAQYRVPGYEAMGVRRDRIKEAAWPMNRNSGDTAPCRFLSATVFAG